MGGVGTTQLRIPGIVLIEELGRGASSVVYRGMRGEKPCAVKLGHSDERAARWFRREAAALARVDDPGLPRVIEVGRAGSVPYIVMELVEGETLASRLARARLDRAEALEFAGRMCRILDAVHRRGLVHRDVKPKNVVLETNGHVRLVDFGFATSVHATQDAAGTRAYAAPEQLRVPAIVDGRTDLYALGRVLYECVTGKRPGGVELEPTSEIDAPLASIIGGLVAADPDARYGSASAVREDLERLARGEPPLGPRADLPGSEPLPFIGRQGQTARITELLAEARHGWGAAVLVRGPRGIGKSRLLRELESGVRGSETMVVRTTCEPNDPRPLAALRATLDRIVALAAPRRPEALARAAGDDLAPVAIAICPALRGILNFDGVAPPVGAEAFAELATELLARIVRELGPVVIALDDAQWIDAVSADVFGRLAQRARQLPLSLLIAGRGDVDRFSPLREGPMPLVTFDLEPFSAEDARALAAAYLGRAPQQELVAWAASVADGTPLGLTEVLDAMLDGGVLEPREDGWHFDRELANRMHLPRGALGLLERKLRELPEATRRVAELAAVIGRAFDHALLARVVGIDLDDLRFAVAQLHRAGLIEATPGASSRFVHDIVREALLEALSPSVRRGMHQRVAETLDVSGADPSALATHYAAGEPERSPERVIEVCHAAATRALAAFDNEAALRLFETAQATAARLGRDLPPAFLIEVAEAELRLGAHAESIEHLETALARTHEPRRRAHVLGRIAWAHQARADADASWAALERAFVELGDRLPKEDLRSAADAAIGWAMSRTRRVDRALDHTARSEIELLCELHYQNVRLGVEYGKPVRLLESIVHARTLAERLGPGAALARTEALYGFVITMLRAREAGREHLARGRQIAAQGAHPTVVAYCIQLGALAACFAGQFDEALELLHTLVDEHGHWLELNELCWNVHSAYVIEALRGRPSDAWPWLERTVARVARHGRPPPSFAIIAHAARATWVMQRRDAEAFGRVLRVPVDFDAPLSGFARTATWGARARYFVERADFGPEFEALLAEHRAEAIDPRRAHPLMAEYYVAIAHARIHQALRAGRGERRLAAEALDRATRVLRAAARDPLAKSHLRYAEAVHAWLCGAAKNAHAKLTEAEQLADRETCVWVRFGIERLRAHMLRESGRTEAARERARAAAHIARDHGAVHWARWIQQELGVSVPQSTARHMLQGGHSASISTSRAQLRSLLNVLRAGAQQLELEEQARLLVDELTATAGADRAFLLFDADGHRARLHTVGRLRGEAPWTPGARVQRAIERAMDTGTVLTAAVEERDDRFDPTSDDVRVVTLPLWLADRTAGAIHLERDPSRPPFSTDDVEILVALSYQVPVALELARAMRERIRLEDALRQAQKMEAVGRLVGGIAHDFNNMMMVVISSVTLLLQKDDIAPDVREELHVLESAIERAVDLTRQLLAFARRQPRRPEPHDASDVIAGLAPMLRRLVPQHIDVRTELWPESLRVHVDRGFFEQALVNLCVNARDAMPDGGTLTLRTSRAVLDEDDVRTRPGLLPGPHVCITVEDTGIGMPREVRENAFDPFFTTKERGQGTGLGLSMVHGFVDQSEGAIEIESEPGRGTLFRIHLPLLPPAAELLESSPPAPRAPEPGPARPARNTILIVEDEPRIRDVLERVLSDEGYDVLTSGQPEHALALVDAPRAAIDLVITDVLMPGMTGVELARAIRARTPSVKLLYMSGYAGPEIRDLESLDPSAFIEKPFRTEAFLTKVRDLLAE